MDNRKKLWFEKLSPLRKKGGLRMPAVLKKEENQNHDNLSTFHVMVLNPKQRQEIYDYYDTHYQETEEANEFCENMRCRRKLEK